MYLSFMKAMLAISVQAVPFFALCSSSPYSLSHFGQHAWSTKSFRMTAWLQARSVSSPQNLKMAKDHEKVGGPENGLRKGP